MGLGLVYGMAWYIPWHGIWYSLTDKARCISPVWPGGHDIMDSTCKTWRLWHGICYGLAGITWYMVWPGGHRMVYGMA